MTSRKIAERYQLLIWFMILICLGINLINSSNAAVKSIDSIPANNWSAGYVGDFRGPTLEESNGSKIYHYLTLRKQINPKWWMAGVFRPDSNFGNDNAAITMADPYLRIGHPSLYIDSRLSLKGEFRYYAPLSEASQASERIGHIQSRLNLIGKYKSMTLLLSARPTYFINTREIAGDSTTAIYNKVLLTYRANRWLSLYLEFKPGWTFKRSLPTLFNEIPARQGVTAKIYKSISISPYSRIILLEPRQSTTQLGLLMSVNLN